jgi:hypothetical protein
MKKKEQIPQWARTGHSKPVTRRDFLAHGIIPFAAYAVAPTVVQMLSSTAHAQSQGCESTSAPMIPIITINLSGGPSLAGQLAVKKLDGSFLSSYTKLGLGAGPNRSFKLDKEFGTVDFAGEPIGGNNPNAIVSQFLQGVRFPRANMMTKITALQKTAFISSSVASQDDSAMNSFDITGLAIKLGMKGQKLPNLGRSDTATGIAAKSALIPPPSPFIVTNAQDLINALGYNKALTNLNRNQQTALARLIASLSNEQTQRIAKISGAESIKKMIDCAGIKNIDLISTGGGDVDAYSTTSNSKAVQLASIWGYNQATPNKSGQNEVFAAMVYNGLIGNASTINLNLGGYDYHDNTRTSGDAKDLAFGQVVGKVLETAELYEKPVFIYVCADGATTSAELSTADSAWTSDRGSAGMQYILAYHPTKRPEVSSNQIGGFNDSQASDSQFPTGSAPEAAAQAIFANYAAWNKKTSFLTENRILTTDVLSKVIKIA